MSESTDRFLLQPNAVARLVYIHAMRAEKIDHWLSLFSEDDKKWAGEALEYCAEFVKTLYGRYISFLEEHRDLSDQELQTRMRHPSLSWADPFVMHLFAKFMADKWDMENPKHEKFNLMLVASTCMDELKSSIEDIREVFSLQNTSPQTHTKGGMMSRLVKTIERLSNRYPQYFLSREDDESTDVKSIRRHYDHTEGPSHCSDTLP